MTQPIAPAVSSVGESKTSASDSFESTPAQSLRTDSSQGVAASPDQLTVLVFKDNFTARTFRIPIRWVNQFGWLLAVSFLAAAFCIALAIKLAISARSHRFNTNYVNADPQAQAQYESRIRDLETQLKEAQGRLQTAGSPQTSASPVANAPVSAAVSENSDAPVIDPALLSPSSPIANSKPFLFKGLPDQVQVPAGEVPITMGAPSARWNGKTLAVRFNLQYVSKNPGGQQGRIVILARGPGMMLAHPAEVFQEVGKDILLNPNKGEYFSVSRYRETKADFGPINSKDSIKEVEVLVLSSTGQLLIHEKITPGKAPGGVTRPSSPAAGAGSNAGANNGTDAGPKAGDDEQ